MIIFVQKYPNFGQKVAKNDLNGCAQIVPHGVLIKSGALYARIPYLKDDLAQVNNLVLEHFLLYSNVTPLS